MEVEGEKYSVYIGQCVSLARQSQVHGPAKVDNDTFAGMQALVFRTEMGDHVVVEPGAKLIGAKLPQGAMSMPVSPNRSRPAPCLESPRGDRKASVTA